MLREVHQGSALYRLHDKQGLFMLSCHLVDLPALDRGVLIVQVVELDLHDLDLRVIGQNPVQNIRLVVEGDADVPDLSLPLQLERSLIRMTALELLIVRAALCVHEVEVEVVDAAPFKLLFKKRPDVLLRLEIRLRQLVRQNVAIPGIAACQSIAKCQL